MSTITIVTLVIAAILLFLLHIFLLLRSSGYRIQRIDRNPTKHTGA